MVVFLSSTLLRPWLNRLFTGKSSRTTTMAANLLATTFVNRSLGLAVSAPKQVGVLFLDCHPLLVLQSIPAFSRRPLGLFLEGKPTKNNLMELQQHKSAGVCFKKAGVLLVSL